MLTANHSQACAFLSQLDADLAQLIALVGTCTLASNDTQEPYEALMRAVAYQQLHPKAGDAILAKFTAYFGAFPSPQEVIHAPFDDLRACGFSGRKIVTLKGIAEGALSGLVPTRAEANTMTDEALIARLVKLKGIGQWTVKMLLMFTLGRMDIMPADDFGVQQGYKRLKSLDIAPKRKEMLEMSKVWSPYRSIASWYLWRVPK
ncbi:MAG TPA: DNA-3-methyladenine glycosylase [Methylotenera sp.]|nr:DNA-3-methyladenine glycosylase [Methylotenera sp.]HPH04599.1 DNA-3-methyladenine glycosylase [Methylotenera sp.]HPN00726.1 DNA-3-methyladenine glycosylase [Methylotenera sp.]